MTATYQALLFVSIVVALALAAYGYRQRPVPEALPFAVFSLGTAAWSAGKLGGILAGGFDASVLWARFSYLGITTVPVAWFVLAARYTGNDDFLNRRRIAVLAASSAAIVLAMWTSDHHPLYYTAIVEDSTALDGISVRPGPFYHVWFALAYSLTVGGCALLAGMLFNDEEIYRQQAGIVLIAALVPLGSNVAYYFDVTTTDFTSVAFIASGILLAWALHRFKFMEVTPVARKTVVDNIQDGVLVLDDRDRIVDANPAARRLLGVPTDRNLLGRVVSDALDEPYDTLVESFTTVERERDVRTFDTDRGRRFVEVDVQPYEQAGGHRRGRLVYLHDVTDRERRERELKRQNEQLDRFASLVSHDLRNPLNVAEGYVANARETGDTDALEEVAIAHERMRGIIDDVLALARSGRTVTDVEPVALDAVAERAWASVATADASLVIGADATVLADASRLQQLFENLFRNAIQHGGDDVTVTVEAVDDGFAVADDGPGIPPDERDAVLEDGFTTHDEGTGLGLSIVASVASAHDWTVDVTASEDGGARFVVTGTTFAREDAPQPAATD